MAAARRSTSGWNGWALPHRFERGLRVTDAATLDVVRMVLAGKVNGELVRLLGRAGGSAVGLSGLDGGLLRAQPLAPDLGYRRRGVAVEPGPVDALSTAGYIPVVAPLALGQDGQVLNVNADDAAADLARGLHAAKLLYLSDVPGILDREASCSPCSATTRCATDRQGRHLRRHDPEGRGGLRALEATQPRAYRGWPRAACADPRALHHRGAGTMIERARPTQGS